MNILLVNDDGIECEGILSLVDALSARHELTVVSPKSERSGFSHSVTLHRDITVWQRKLAGHESVPAFAISGTPADCAKLGVRRLCKRKPDLIISGINNGMNIGTDTLYSGTVSAALEGALMGIPSLAMSLFYYEKAQYEQAARFAAALAEQLLPWPLDTHTALNINYPDPSRGAPKGVRCCTLATLSYNEHYEEAGIEADGGQRLRLYGELAPCGDAHSDETALISGYISVTPMRFGWETAEMPSVDIEGWAKFI